MRRRTTIVRDLPVLAENDEIEEEENETNDDEYSEATTPGIIKINTVCMLHLTDTKIYGEVYVTLDNKDNSFFKLTLYKYQILRETEEKIK